MTHDERLACAGGLLKTQLLGIPVHAACDERNINELASLLGRVERQAKVETLKGLLPLCEPPGWSIELQDPLDPTIGKSEIESRIADLEAGKGGESGGD